MNRDMCEDATILKKALLEDLSEAEKQELEKLLEHPLMRDVYDQLKNTDFLTEEFRLYDTYCGKEGYRRFLQRIHRERRRKREIRLITSAAAVLLLAFGLGIRHYMQPVVPYVVPEAATVIPAGENKAQLTLADGQVIPIADETISLEEQNGSHIEYKDGHLSYQTEKELPELVYNTLEVPRGGECSLTLEDGSRVWVNADSKLRYPVAFNGQAREVYLEGEAYFDVQSCGQPFIVHTSFGRVNVLGTAFGVTAYREEKHCYTTLERGQVSFEVDGGEPLVIAPGEQVVASLSGELHKRAVNTEEFTGWKYGLYVFKEKPLEEIMETLSRWYDISVVYQSEDLKRLPFTGNLERYDRINIFLNALVRTGLVHYRIEGRQVMLSK